MLPSQFLVVRICNYLTLEGQTFIILFWYLGVHSKSPQVILFFAELGIEPRALSILGKNTLSYNPSPIPRIRLMVFLQEAGIHIYSQNRPTGMALEKNTGLRG
jgi:hypothetical protein